MTTGSLHHLLGVAWTVALTVTAVWAVAPRGHRRAGCPRCGDVFNHIVRR